MDFNRILATYIDSEIVGEVAGRIREGAKFRLVRSGGSVLPLWVAALRAKTGRMQVVVLDDREEAAYFYSDLVAFTGGKEIGFLPSSYRKGSRDNDSVLARTEVLSHIRSGDLSVLITYPEAFFERVPEVRVMNEMSMTLKRGDVLSVSFLEEVLTTYGFKRGDFVYAPGEYAVRGSIVDIYSYAGERPMRVDFFGDEIESIRFFDIETQLSDSLADLVCIFPDLNAVASSDEYTDLFRWFETSPLWWLRDGRSIYEKMKSLFETRSSVFSDPESLRAYVESSQVVEWGADRLFEGENLDLMTESQPPFNKRFDMLADYLGKKREEGYAVYICALSEKQFRRLEDIFEDKGYGVEMSHISGIVHEGFVDEGQKICLFTEHQIFDRYHKYRTHASCTKKGRESVSLNDLRQWHPGDYVVHIDHGIGRFGGLVKVENGGNVQESVRIVYRDNSELYVGLHSLHKISKYRGVDGELPRVDRLGGTAWNRLKQKTKSRVKDIARELIALYARRKEEEAFAFSPDSYIQEELEASFVYDETPDQEKAIEAVKRDMEAPRVMDRLICGDVGFGKTEVAIRAAFKAVADNKQVAVLVPTTILAYQHYNTFCERLKGMPCKIEYISRMRNASVVKNVLKEVKEGKVDILIGTHRLTGKDVIFKDMGLLIVDEEQKFGVGVKEKLKQLRLNVDTLTMTATPIPRTLQFSLMGVRDMSIIRTPPPNRYPIVTELHRFSEELIEEAVRFEVLRGGQVFFVHNKVDSLGAIERMLERILPGVKTCSAHGRMSGAELEEVMHDFVRGDYDVLVATTIIESGLDIPNANTIIINDAQNYGLSDLHQLRGRVGRSDKKAFCYLLSPPLEFINSDARRRLKAIEDFSGLGSGFNIAMQDLDIRGVGNILGAEQSGFIAEIGYETYYRILNEALLELQAENPDMPIHNEEVVSHECLIESDFEVMIPDTYVENISERIKLYRELDNMKETSEIENFESGLRDRFGPVPKPLKDLLKIVEIRPMCVEIGAERLIVKEGKMVLFFLSDQNAPYYASDRFTALLRFVQRQAIPSRMVEKKEKLSLVVPGIKNVDAMTDAVKKIYREICGLKSEI